MTESLDVKLEDLFRWKGAVDIVDQDGNVVETLYQRIVSDKELREIRILALKESRLFRKELRTPDSDIALAFLPLKEELTKDDMIVTISFSKYSDFKKEAELTISQEKIKEPTTEKLEDHEEYIEKVEKAVETYQQKLSEKIQKLIESYADELKTKSEDELYKMFLDAKIDLLANQRFMEVYDELCAFYGTYKDSKFKERRFKSLDEFKSLAPNVKMQIMIGYKKLELGVEEIKK